MSLSFGSSSKTTNSSQQQQTEPWAPTIPYLTRFLGDLDNSRSTMGPSTDQLDAFTKLKQNAAAGNPYTGDINSLAKAQFGTQSQSGTISDAYKRLQDQLGGYASGQKLDFQSNPYIQQMLKTVGDDTQSRINRMYAGAGRDLSGINQQAVSRGVQQAQLPILSDLYSKEEGNQIGAAGTLFNAGTSAATTGQGLDAAALATRAGGIQTGQAGIDASNYGPNAILNLDQQLKGIPTGDMATYENLLLPVSGLGGQGAGKGTSTTNGSSMGLGLNILSDERAKEDVARVGKTDDGQPIYSFHYKGSDRPEMGLIAQNVEKTNPDAVSEGEDGLKRVNYDKALAKAKAIAAARRRA